MKLKIRSKLLMSFMSMVVLIAALVGILYVCMGFMAGANHRLVLVQEKAALVSDLQTALDRAVTALGNYLLTGKKAHRATFIQLIFFFKRQIETLEEYQAYGIPGASELSQIQKEAIQALKEDVATIENTSRELISFADKIEEERGHEIIRGVAEMLKGALSRSEPVDLPEKGIAGLKQLEELLGVPTDEAQERLKELASLGRTIYESRWKELTDQLIAAKESALETIVEIRTLAQREGIFAVESAAAADARARKYMLVGTIVILTLGLGLALYLSRSLSRPIRELAKGARMVGEGSFEQEMMIDTGDELEELANCFSTMAARVKETYSGLEGVVRERTRELEQSHDHLKRLFDAIGDGVSIISRDYTVANANVGMGTMAGREVAYLRGKRCYRVYNGSEKPCPGCPAEITFAKGTPASAQISWAVPGKRPKEIEISIFPLMEEEGRVTHVIEYARDITDKKIMEQTLFQSAKLAGIGTLAAGIAHEIRNPLGIIKASADMVKKSCAEDEQNYELSDFMIGEVDRLNRVVSRLLDFAKPSKPRMQDCNLSEIISHALALVSPHYRLQDKTITKEYETGIPPVKGDSEQLCQLFFNLIINATQVMEGEGTLSLATGSADDETVFASVSDTGPGIRKKDIEKIFDPFYSTRDGGTGLGLAIVHRIAEAHKGRVEVTSTPGKGTTFTVFLPAA